MSDEHGHDGHQHDGHGHEHPGMDYSDELSWAARRFRAIEALLEEKGICTWVEVSDMVNAIESRTPADGARVVARAWVDPEFKRRLLDAPLDAIPELGIPVPDNMPALEVLENTDEVHHIVVCTLCSCYPRGILGRPPDWYKSLDYRSRTVIEPRSVMQEFGLDLPEQVRVEVRDSTADLRYLVLPKRPAGTEGWSEEELAKLVTRDSMIGVTEALAPDGVPAG